MPDDFSEVVLYVDSPIGTKHMARDENGVQIPLIRIRNSNFDRIVP